MHGVPGGLPASSFLQQSHRQHGQYHDSFQSLHQTGRNALRAPRAEGTGSISFLWVLSVALVDLPSCHCMATQLAVLSAPFQLNPGRHEAMLCYSYVAYAMAL